MTLECESQHVGDDMGTHEDSSAKGPAFNHQDAERGLQVRLFRQVLETGQQEATSNPREEERSTSG